MIGFDNIGNQARPLHDVIGFFDRGNQVIKSFLNGFMRYPTGIKVQTLTADAVDFTQVVDAMEVVGMRMRVQNAVNIPDVLINQLGTQVRAGIYQQFDAVVFKIGCGAQPVVFEVFGIAFAPAASQRRNAHCRSATQNNQTVHL